MDSFSYGFGKQLKVPDLILNKPYTSANGHMFSLFNKASEIGIRFLKEVQKKYFVAANQAGADLD